MRYLFNNQCVERQWKEGRAVVPFIEIEAIQELCSPILGPFPLVGTGRRERVSYELVGQYVTYLYVDCTQSLLRCRATNRGGSGEGKLLWFSSSATSGLFVVPYERVTRTTTKLGLNSSSQKSYNYYIARRHLFSLYAIIRNYCSCSTQRSVRWQGSVGIKSLK